MKAAKKKLPKSYWEMNTAELAEATREFDRELVPDNFHPLGPEKQLVWQRLQSKKEDQGLTLTSLDDITALRAKIKKAAGALTQSIKKIISSRKPVEVLRDFKLDTLGFDPYAHGQKMNLVEQINQSATLLVACAAVALLLRKHPSSTGYVVSRPTTKGFDLWAVDASVAAEVFAATSPASNQKISKDLKAVLAKKVPLTPRYRYVFFAYRSLKGFPPAAYTFEGPEHDSALGEVWYLVEHGRRSVTVVPLDESAVFCA